MKVQISKSTLWVIYSFIVLLGISAYCLSYQTIKLRKEKDADSELKIAHIRSVEQVSLSLNVFGAVASGVQGFVNSSEEMPNSETLQKFLNLQLENIYYESQIALSFIDTTDVFKYSFTRDSINPYDLEGRKMSSLRSKEEVIKINEILNTPYIRFYPPINLVEGWVGIPINFRVRREEKTLGYIAILVKFKSLVESLYDLKGQDNFVYKFKMSDVLFDREEVYNGSMKHNDLEDIESCKNFNIDSSSYVYSSIPLLGEELVVGTAFKNKDSFSFVSLTNLLLVLSVFGPVILMLLLVHSTYTQSVAAILAKSHNRRLREVRKTIVRQNEELQKLNKAKDKLTEIIAHDIKGPLGSLSNLLDLLKMDLKSVGKSVDVVSRIKLATQSIVKLLDDLLDWSISQSGDIAFNKKKLRLNDILHANISLLEQSALDKSTEIVLSISPAMEICGDENMLSTVFRNFISNAIKFSHHYGTIKISVFEKDNNWMTIQIQDNGIGMSELKLKKIFLDREHSLGTDGERGSGLGLLVCKEFVERHNGKIEVESVLGKGTTIKINLPIECD